MVRAAADRTAGVGTARVEVSLGSDMLGRGVVDLPARRGSFTFARTGALAHLGDQFDVVVDGAQEWVRASGGGGGIPGTSAAQPWTAGTPRAVTAQAHARVNPLDTVLVRPGLGTDLAFLRGAINVKSYGGEEVRGVNAYRYTLEVDLAAAIADSPPADRPALQAASDAIGPVVWPADVWLDSDGRVRRLQMAENPFAHTTTTRANLLFGQDGNYLALTNIQFYDFGTPATITSPPVDQVVKAVAS